MTYNKTKYTPLPPKRSREMVKNRNNKDQSDKDQRKERWRNGSNNMKGRRIEHKFDGDTRGMTRREQVVISRLRKGYTRATHGLRMNGIIDPQCRFCDTGLTVDHVLWDCTETEQAKREIMMTPEIWTRGAEGMKKIKKYTKK
jgi:hypothetical protein